MPDKQRASSAVLAALPHLGHVFTVGEKPSFTIETQADEIRYVIRDYTSNIVTEGTCKPGTEFAPTINSLGWFHVRLSSPSGTKEFNFGIVRSFTGLDLTASPFGVMTHFAQKWNTDLIPLLAKYGIATVQIGTLVDFCITPGQNNDLSYDAFSFEVRIFARNIQ